MKATHQITASLALATLLLTGCGSSGSTSNTDGVQGPSAQTTSGKISLETDKLSQIKRDLQNRNITYQASSYSKDKSTIMIVGLEKGKTTFYKFDANSLTLIDQFEFKVDGVIGVKTAEAGDKFTIISTKDNQATDYTVDMTNKKLEKKQEYVLRAPKVIIQEQLGKNFTVERFIFTPSKMGGLVIASNTDKRELFLYGMEDPAAPAQEYAIVDGPAKQHIQNIKLLGNGIITFEKVNEDEPNKIAKIKYDYFNKKELSSQYLGKTDVNYRSLEEAIKQDLNTISRSRYAPILVTPTKLGAIITVKDGDYMELYLYGLEDLQHPKREKLIARVKSRGFEPKIIKNGVLEYSYADRDSGDGHTVTYDYFKNEVVNDVVQKNNFHDIESTMQSIFDEKWKKRSKRWKNGAPENIKVIAKLTDNLYLVKHNVLWFDNKFGTKILDFNTKTFKKTLAWMHIGPGGEVAKDISVDRENHRVNYKVALSEYGDMYGGVSIPHDELNRYVGGKESRYYDYLTDTITKGILPLKIDDTGHKNHGNPFYSPDKNHLFTVSNSGIDLYDKEGKFVKTLYTFTLPKARYTGRNIEEIKFPKEGQISFRENTFEYGHSEVHEPYRYIDVVLDYVNGSVVSTSDIQYKVGTDGTEHIIMTKNKEKIIKVVSDSILSSYNVEYGGKKDKELYKTGDNNKYIVNLKNVDEDTISFQVKTYNGDNPPQLTEIIMNYKTGERISQ